MQYQLPPLSYSYDALEPYIDSKTMEIHYTKHHQGYLNNLNSVLEKYPNLQKKDLRDLIRNLERLKMDKADKITLRNNGGGHLNHALFWEIMGPKKEKDEKLIKMIEKEFVSVDKFKSIFSQKAVSHFGSGWAWLVLDEKKRLRIYSLPNQDSPYLKNHQPIIGLDVWEHAYYLKYQNRRAEYVQNWWNVLKLI